MTYATLIRADARRIPLADKSVHCVITSPPYWNLRDYGVEGQIGLEPNPDAFVESMRSVFREVHRVLRDDGTLWLNLGDSYGGDRGNKTPAPDNKNRVLGSGSVHGLDRDFDFRKQLIGIPWRVALALQSDGWYLRSDIIWAKKSPMPESVTDRPTKAHEYLFLLSKRPDYFYDVEAVKEKSVRAGDLPGGGVKHSGNLTTPGHQTHNLDKLGGKPVAETKNLRSVWSLSHDPYPGAHFATFPRKLVEPCIKAGTSEKGCCPSCGSPWRRVTERSALKRERPNDYVKRSGEDGTGNSCGNTVAGVSVRTLGWEPTCGCPEHTPVPCTVFDPFNGSGTSGVVALALGRNYVGTDLNRDYLGLARRRIERPHAPVERPGLDEPLPLFSEAAK